MRILITGVAGFIGFHLTKQLLGDGHEIFGVDNLNNYYAKTLKIDRLKRLKSKNFHFIENDILNLIKINNSFDVAINLAAQPGIRVKKELEENYLKTNISGFKSFTDFCINKKVKRIIYASSSSVYDDSDTSAFSENRTKLNPKSLYGLTKLFNEKYSELIYKQNNLKIIGLRFFSVYGPYGRPDMAYYSFTDAISKNKTILLYNEGEMARDMTYIDDIINGITRSIKFILDSKESSLHEIFNLGNNNPIQTSHLLKSIEENLQVSAVIKHAKTSNESSFTHADLYKSKNVLGYNPTINFNDGIREFLNWYKDYE